MLNNLNESKIQKIMNEVNDGKYDNYKFIDWDNLFLKCQQFYDDQGDETKKLFMLAERLIHSMKYDPKIKQFKSELDEKIQPRGGQFSYYRMRSYKSNSPILRAKYADIAWKGLKEDKLLIYAIKSYNQSFSLLLERGMNSKLIEYLVRSIHLIYNLSSMDNKLKIDTLNIVIENLETIIKKKEIIWIKKTIEPFNALLAEDVKDCEEINWLKACSLLGNVIQLLPIQELSRNIFENLLKICKSRI